MEDCNWKKYEHTGSKLEYKIINMGLSYADKDYQITIQEKYKLNLYS